MTGTLTNRRLLQPSLHNGTRVCVGAAQLFATDVVGGFSDRLNKRRFTEREYDVVTAPWRGNTRRNGTKFFELFKMPLNGLVAGTYRRRYIPGCGALLMGGEVAQNFRTKRRYPQDRDHLRRRLGYGVLGEHITRHPPILT